MAIVSELDYGSSFFNMFKNTEPLDSAKSTKDYYLYMPRTYGSSTIKTDIRTIETHYKGHITDLYTERFKKLFMYSTTRSTKETYSSEIDIVNHGILGTFDLFRALFGHFPAQYLPLIQPFVISDDFIEKIKIDELTLEEITILIMGEEDLESDPTNIINTEILKRKAQSLCDRINGVYDKVYFNFVNNVKNFLSYYHNNKDILNSIKMMKCGVYEKNLIKNIYNGLILLLRLLVYSVSVKSFTDLANFKKLEVEENLTIIREVSGLKPDAIITVVLHDILRPDNTENITSIEKHVTKLLIDRYLTITEKESMKYRYDITDPLIDNITVEFEEPKVSDVYLSLGQSIDNIRSIINTDIGESNIYGHEMNRFLRIIAGFELLYILAVSQINKKNPKNIFEEIFDINYCFESDVLEELIDLDFRTPES